MIIISLQQKREGPEEIRDLLVGRLVRFAQPRFFPDTPSSDQLRETPGFIEHSSCLCSYKEIRWCVCVWVCVRKERLACNEKESGGETKGGACVREKE